MLMIQQQQIDDLKSKIAKLAERFSHLQESRARASAMADGCEREPDRIEWTRKARDFAALASTIHEEKVALVTELTALQSLPADAVNPAALTETRTEISRIQSALVQNKAAIAAQFEIVAGLESDRDEAADDVASARLTLEDLLASENPSTAAISTAEKNLAKAQADCEKRIGVISEKIERSNALISGLERRRRGFEAELKAANLKARLVEQSIAESAKSSGLARLESAYNTALLAYRALVTGGHYHPAQSLFQRHLSECQSVKF